MINNSPDADVIVVGGGHAGCEAAAASARTGAKTILVTGSIQALARMSCNPAIGGIAKGHLVREIDALGGIMGIVTDASAIQYRVLNRSKGTAVWSPRAQCDRKLYSKIMKSLMERYPGVTLIEGMVTSVEVSGNSVTNVVLDDARKIYAPSIILTCGTFLNGLMHCGETQEKGGRVGEPPVVGLTRCITDLGFQAGRLKTGTPPRLDGRTIDHSQTERQDSDEEPIFFHWKTDQVSLPQRPCWITHTNEKVHQVLRSGLDRSPLFTGKIEGRGPRYCPSIEDKIFRFADKESHTIFLEPEGLDTEEVYPNGFSSSLPADVQFEAIRHIPGLQNVEMTRPGYAVEYDFFPPHQLRPTLETKLIDGLFFAGQINGTSGYEEAAAQGLIAGVNAAMAAKNSPDRLTIGREEAYIGVLIDDLITRGTDEPYRMFTSRAEYRLQLRLDNAGTRLRSKAMQFGLIEKDHQGFIDGMEEKMATVLKYLSTEKSVANEGQVYSLYEMMRRPEVNLLDLLHDRANAGEINSLIESSGVELIRRVESEVKYEGYLRRQEGRILELQKNRDRLIPLSIDFSEIKGISIEAKEKLLAIRPTDIGQAYNIPGITPADIAILLIHLKRSIVKHR